MKKKIEDYIVETYGNEVGIYCSNKDEFKAICTLIRPDGLYTGRNDYHKDIYDTIGIYKSGQGWSSRSSYKTIYPASDFLEEQEVSFPIFN